MLSTKMGVGADLANEVAVEKINESSLGDGRGLLETETEILR